MLSFKCNSIQIFVLKIKEKGTRLLFTDLEIGAETRYEITRKFAPYFALRYHAKTFGTADLAKQMGQRVDNFIIVAGIRLRF